MLVVGGLPRSRLPMLVTLIVIAAGLLTLALLQLRRQQELARLRTEFVSGVSHELRTPLAQIRWFAELLHMGKLRSEDERVRSAGIIDQEARRLTYLVENVLNFSRGEKGVNRVSMSPAELDHEILEALELFRAARASAEDDRRHGARRQRRRLARSRRVSSDFAQPARQRREIWAGRPDDHRGIGDRRRPRARIWVEDQGPGIPHDDRQRVWEPYVRLNRDVESATGGSGIGLSVVRRARHPARRAHRAPRARRAAAHAW